MGKVVIPETITRYPQSKINNSSIAMPRVEKMYRHHIPPASWPAICLPSRRRKTKASEPRQSIWSNCSFGARCLGSSSSGAGEAKPNAFGGGNGSLFDIPLGIQSWIKDGSRLVLHHAVRNVRVSNGVREESGICGETVPSSHRRQFKFHSSDNHGSWLLAACWVSYNVISLFVAWRSAET